MLDTNVLISALRSNRGASFKLLSLIGTEAFEIAISVPLVLEYEEAALRVLPQTALTEADIRDVLDYICSVGTTHDIHYLWRPLVRDPKDDHLLELAVASGCESIVTYNLRDFAGARHFNVRVEPPAVFLKRIGEIR